MNAAQPEAWRPVVGHPAYFVSDQGRIRSTKSWRGTEPLILKPGLKRGYEWVALDRVARLVHQVVAEAFIGPRPDGYDTRHLDGDKRNNHAENLAYGTRSENQLDSVRHGVHHHAAKTHCKHGHPFDEANTYRYLRGGREQRVCRTCQRDAVARYAARKRGIAA